jgi:hypothetical protein
MKLSNQVSILKKDTKFKEKIYLNNNLNIAIDESQLELKSFDNNLSLLNELKYFIDSIRHPTRVKEFKIESLKVLNTICYIYENIKKK